MKKNPSNYNIEVDITPSNLSILWVSITNSAPSSPTNQTRNIYINGCMTGVVYVGYQYTPTGSETQSDVESYIQQNISFYDYDNPSEIISNELNIQSFNQTNDPGAAYAHDIYAENLTTDSLNVDVQNEIITGSLPFYLLPPSTMGAKTFQTFVCVDGNSQSPTSNTNPASTYSSSRVTVECQVPTFSTSDFTYTSNVITAGAEFPTDSDTPGSLSIDEINYSDYWTGQSSNFCFIDWIMDENTDDRASATHCNVAESGKNESILMGFTLNTFKPVDQPSYFFGSYPCSTFYIAKGNTYLPPITTYDENNPYTPVWSDWYENYYNFWYTPHIPPFTSSDPFSLWGEFADDWESTISETANSPGLIVVRTNNGGAGYLHKPNVPGDMMVSRLTIVDTSSIQHPPASLKQQYSNMGYLRARDNFGNIINFQFIAEWTSYNIHGDAGDVRYEPEYGSVTYAIKLATVDNNN